MQISELKEELDIGKYGDLILDYDSQQIYDIFYNISDDTDCYWSDLLDWLKEGNNEYYVEEAVNEGLVDCKNFDLFKALQCGEFKEREEDLYSHLEDIVTYRLYDYIQNDLKMEELTTEQISSIGVMQIDADSDLVDLFSEVREILGIDEGE